MYERVRAKAGCAGPASAMLVAFSVSLPGPNQAASGSAEAPDRRTAAVLSPSRAQEAAESRRQRPGFGRAVCGSPAPPPPGQASAGERQRENERPVACLPPAEAAVRASSRLTVVPLVKGGRKDECWLLWPPAVRPRSLFPLVKKQQRSAAISPWKVKTEKMNSGNSAVALLK